VIGTPPTNVRVTIVAGPRGPTLRKRIGALLARASPRAIACFAILAVAVAAVGAATLRGGGRAGCVSVGIAFHDPRFGRASFDRRFPCLRGVDPPATGAVSPAAGG
jgi:hypothetical protein